MKNKFWVLMLVLATANIVASWLGQSLLALRLHATFGWACAIIWVAASEAHRKNTELLEEVLDEYRSKLANAYHALSWRMP